MFHFPTSQSIMKMEPSDQSGMVWWQGWHQFWRWRCVGWGSNSAESKVLEPEKIHQWFHVLFVACRHLQTIWRWNSEWMALRKWAILCSKISFVLRETFIKSTEGMWCTNGLQSQCLRDKAVLGLLNHHSQSKSQNCFQVCCWSENPHHLTVLQDGFSECRINLLLQHNIWLYLAPFPPRHPICLQSASCLQRALLTHPKYVIRWE